MRFPKEARAAIRAAAPAPVTIDWPAGQPQPEAGKVYRLQRSSEEINEERRIARKARQENPQTHREVMAEMHRRAHGEYPPGYELPKIEGPSLGDLRIKVLEVEILQKGWKAKVVLWEAPDPIHGAGVKAKHHHPSGPTTLQTYGESVTEGEPERVSIEIEEALTLEAHELRVKPAREVIEGIEAALADLQADPAAGQVSSEVEFLQKRLARLKLRVERYPEVA